jgi:hypothetical protein
MEFQLSKAIETAARTLYFKVLIDLLVCHPIAEWKSINRMRQKKRERKIGKCTPTRCTIMPCGKIFSYFKIFNSSKPPKFHGSPNNIFNQILCTFFSTPQNWFKLRKFLLIDQ